MLASLRADKQDLRQFCCSCDLQWIVTSVATAAEMLCIAIDNTRLIPALFVATPVSNYMQNKTSGAV